MAFLLVIEIPLGEIVSLKHMLSEEILCHENIGSDSRNNEKTTIREILQAVSAVDLETEIIVVDDFSTDGTRESSGV